MYGKVRTAFEKRGHYAISCDILPCETKGCHYWGRVEDIINNDWDLIIAHPPCTYLCNSGVSWLHRDQSRWGKMIKAAKFFKMILENKCPKIAIENPIMHKYAIDIIGRRQDQVIQPYMFGHPERKATCLWLKNLEKIEQTNNVKHVMDSLPKKQSQRIHYASPSKDRWKIRSETFQGIADAMATQWG